MLFSFEIFSASLMICARKDRWEACSTCRRFRSPSGSVLSSTSRTKPATSTPKAWTSSSLEGAVSSTVSCKKAAAIRWASGSVIAPGNQNRNFYEVGDVWFGGGSLAFLVGVLGGGKVNGSQDELDGGEWGVFVCFGGSLSRMLQLRWIGPPLTQIVHLEARRFYSMWNFLSRRRTSGSANSSAHSPEPFRPLFSLVDRLLCMVPAHGVHHSKGYQGEKPPEKCVLHGVPAFHNFRRLAMISCAAVDDHSIPATGPQCYQATIRILCAR